MLMNYQFWTVNTCMYTITWAVNKKKQGTPISYNRVRRIWCTKTKKGTLDISDRINTSRTQ